MKLAIAGPYSYSPAMETVKIGSARCSTLSQDPDAPGGARSIIRPSGEARTADTTNPESIRSVLLAMQPEMVPAFLCNRNFQGQEGKSCKSRSH